MKIFTFSIRKNFFNIVLVIFIILLVLFSNSNLIATKNGLTLWANNIIPALFPFFIATELLNSTNIVYIFGNLFNKFMRPIFNLPGEATYPLIMGFISGYPVGAKIVSDLRNKNILTRAEAERLLAFTNNSGPLFIIGTIGIGLFKDTTTGLILLLTHIVAALTVGIIFRFWKYNDTNISSTSNSVNIHANNICFSNIGITLGTAIKNSIVTILNIGGFIVFFSVIISILNKMHFIYLIELVLNPILNIFNISNDFSNGIINGIFEITNGLQQISSIPIKNISFSIIISAFILGFGGISVILQVSSFTSKTDISIKPYIIGKLLQGILSAFYTFIIFHFFSFLSLDLSNIVKVFEYL